MRVWLPLSVLALWALMTVGGQYLSLTPNLIHLEKILATPGSGALLGFDDLGRQIDERLLIGARTSFLVAFWVVGLSMLVGTVAGTASAYLGGVVGPGHGASGGHFPGISGHPAGNCPGRSAGAGY